MQEKDKKMISVCMGLYNGERYLEEQLQSILQQTKTPDEVILCDDGSTDATVKIAKQFIEKNGLGSCWKLFCNESNKGYPENLYYAMSLCQGDLVFLADQDDIWELHKIEKMSSLMKQDKEILALCCKFGLVDAEGKDIHSIMAPAQSHGTENLRAVSITDVFRKCEWPGMVIAYRRKWYEERMSCWQENNKKADCSEKEAKNAVQKEKTAEQKEEVLTEKKAEWWTKGKEMHPKIPHDFLVCAWAAEEGGFRQLDQELAYHRRHDSNTGGEEHRIGRLLNASRKQKEIRDYLRILGAFTTEQVLNTKEGEEALKTKKKTMEERYTALCSGKVIAVLKSAWKNRHNTRLVTVVCDVLICLRRPVG